MAWEKFAAMSREFPDVIDPWKAADGRREFRGTMPLRRMKRLTGMLAPSWKGSEQEAGAGTEARFQARFGHDRQGLVTVDLQVSAELPLVCQRNLEPYLEPVSRRSKLAVIESLAEQEELPESYEPVHVEHRRLALLDLVEDELLLGVPQVPRNRATKEIELSTDGEVAKPATPEEEKTHRPFEGLAGLMNELED